MEITVFCDVISCSLTRSYCCLNLECKGVTADVNGDTCISFSYMSNLIFPHSLNFYCEAAGIRLLLKCWYLPTRPHGITFQKAVTFQIQNSGYLKSHEMHLACN